MRLSVAAKYDVKVCLPAGLLTHLQITDWHMLPVHAMTTMMKSTIPGQKPAVQECQSLGRLFNQCAGA